MRIIIFVLWFSSSLVFATDSNEGRKSLVEKTFAEFESMNQDGWVEFSSADGKKFVQFRRLDDEFYFYLGFSMEYLPGTNPWEYKIKVTLIDDCPSINGPTEIRQYPTYKYQSLIINVLKNYKLDTSLKCEVLKDKKENIIGLKTILYSMFSVDSQRRYEFVNEIFTKVYGLSDDYEIEVIKNI